jgi:hypothetical protein
MSVEPLEISHETIGRNLQKTGEKAAAVPLTKLIFTHKYLGGYDIISLFVN